MFSISITTRLLGILVLAWWLGDLYLGFQYYNNYNFLWFCSISMLLLAIGLLLMYSPIIWGFLYVAVVVHGLWFIDFLLYIVSGYSVGFVGYLFDYNISPVEYFNALRHMIMVPISIIGLVLIGYLSQSSTDWLSGRIWSRGIVIVVTVVTLIFTDPRSNINCIPRFCGVEGGDIWWWYLILYFIVMLFVSGWWLPRHLFKVLEIIVNYKCKLRLLLSYVILLFVISGVGWLSYSSHIHVTCIGSEVICYGVFSYGDTVSAEVLVPIGDGDFCKIRGSWNDEDVGYISVFLIDRPYLINFPLSPPNQTTILTLWLDCSDM